MKTNAIVRIVLFSLLLVILLGVFALGMAAWMGVNRYFLDAETGTQVALAVEPVSGNEPAAPAGEEPAAQAGGEPAAQAGEEPAAQAGEEPAAQAGGEPAVRGGQVYEIPVDGITDLEIQWVAGNVTIRPGQVEAITFSETPGEYPLACYMDEGTLIVRFREGKWKHLVGLNPAKVSKDLTVTVPQDWSLRDIEIQAVDANVEIRDMILEDLEFEGVSGRFQAENCQVRELSMETVSGDVSYSGTLEEMDVDAVSADCTVILTNVPREIELDGVSGDLDLTLPANAGITAEMDSVSGRIRSDIPGTLSGKSFTCGSGACHIRVEGISGNLNLHAAP